jgi:hypothetical protein
MRTRCWSRGASRGLAGLALTLAGLAGCARGYSLTAAPSAHWVAGPIVPRHGVTVHVGGAGWRGDPSDLASRVVPLEVTVENRSGSPIMVRYGDFRLVLPPGEGPPLRAIAPLAGGGPLVVDLTAGQPAGANEDFVVVSPVEGEPGMPGWRRPSPPFIDDNGTFYAYSGRRLPTFDMLRRALPERVLGDGERAAGFVYFEPAPGPLSRAVLTFALVSASSDRILGSVEVPLVAQP